jgi:hypothetical protein
MERTKNVFVPAKSFCTQNEKTLTMSVRKFICSRLKKRRKPRVKPVVFFFFLA